MLPYGQLFGSILKEKMFLETVLQMLLICVCHFTYLSTVTPSKRCSETCSTGVDERLKFKDSFSFWRFCQVAINMHFVLVGFSAIKYVQHQSETSLRLCCKSLRILSMLSMAVLRVPSSANKSHFTDLGERHRDKSLVKMPNRRAQDRPQRNSTSPHVIDVSWEYVPFTSMRCSRPYKQDCKNVIVSVLQLQVDSFFNKML